MIVLSIRIILEFMAFPLTVFAATVKGNNFKQIETSTASGLTYELGDVTYFANSQYPKSIISGHGISSKEDTALITVIVSDNNTITGDYLKTTISKYLQGDDVFTSDFLESIYISLLTKRGSLDSSALQYLASIGTKNLYLDLSIFNKTYSHNAPRSVQVANSQGSALPAGPYTAIISDGVIKLCTTYRLYRDEYKSFITGSYDSNDGEGSHAALEVMNSRFWEPMIPVPSRIYSWSDKRVLAGTRVAIKDLFDVKGLQTSGGSKSWITITPIANGTAPAIQRLVRVKSMCKEQELTTSVG
jgi:hypothetical protein